MSLITKPIKPTAPMPRTLIFIDSHSSSLSGFEASFKVLAACCSHDLNPILTALTRFHLGIINVTVIFKSFTPVLHHIKHGRQEAKFSLLVALSPQVKP